MHRTQKSHTAPSRPADEADAGEHLLAVMQQIAPWLDEAYPGWVIFGSAALWLNGVQDVRPHDIDILVPGHGEDASDWDEGPLFRSRQHTKRSVEGIEVDISEELHVRRHGRWMPVTVVEVVCRSGLRFASLAECKRLLRLFDRPKDRERLQRLKRE